MAGFSDYLENAALNHFFRNTSTAAGAAWVALFTAITDAEAGTGTECSFTAYARVQVTFSAASGGAITTSGNTDFVAKGDAGTVTVTHAGLFDAVSAGNTLTALTALSASVDLTQNDIFRFPTGDIDVSLD